MDPFATDAFDPLATTEPWSPEQGRSQPKSIEPEFVPAPVHAPSRSAGSISARARANAAPLATAGSYLEGLNPEQRLAVETADGPVLVLAGAGTGKTRVLITRIAHIMATRSRLSKPDPRGHLHQQGGARNEAPHRCAGRRRGRGHAPGSETFHSIGVKILRRHSEIAGLKSGFTILDSDDQLRLMKQVIDVNGIDKERWPARGSWRRSSTRGRTRA